MAKLVNAADLGPVWLEGHCGFESRLPHAGRTHMKGTDVGARSKENPPRKRGPKPETLVLPGPWEGNLGTALKKPAPPGGWPKPKPKKKGPGK